MKQVDVAREIKVKNICCSNVDLRPGLSIDLSIFPPCSRILAQHLKRVNFQVCIWRRALDHFSDIPYSVSMSTWSLLMLPILHIPVTSFGMVRIMILISV